MGLKTDMSASRLAAGPFEATNLEAGHTSALFERMLLIRRFEEKVGLLVALGAIGEAPALACARESLPACVSLAMVPGDRFFSSTGSLAALLARDISLRELCAALLDKQDVRALGTAGIAVLNSSAEDVLRASAAEPLEGNVAFCWIEATHEVIPHLSAIGKPAGARVICLELRRTRDGETDESLEADSRRALTQSNCPVFEADGLDAGRLLTVLIDASHSARMDGRTRVVLVRTPAFHGHAPVSGGQADAGREAWDPIARLRARMVEECLASDASLKATEKRVRERVSSAASAARGLQ